MTITDEEALMEVQNDLEQLLITLFTKEKEINEDEEIRRAIIEIIKFHERFFIRFKFPTKECPDAYSYIETLVFDSIHGFVITDGYAATPISWPAPLSDSLIRLLEKINKKTAFSRFIFKKTLEEI